MIWRGGAALLGTRFERVEPVNFLNPERQLGIREPGVSVGWQSVTTGNLAGFDIWLERDDGRLDIETNIVSGSFDLPRIGFKDSSLEAGGLGRRIRVFRLPERNDARSLAFDHDVAFTGPSDLPVYVRVTQEDGHQAWSSPIYLIS